MFTDFLLTYTFRSRIRIISQYLRPCFSFLAGAVIFKSIYLYSTLQFFTTCPFVIIDSFWKRMNHAVIIFRRSVFAKYGADVTNQANDDCCTSFMRESGFFLNLLELIPHGTTYVYVRMKNESKFIIWSIP